MGQGLVGYLAFRGVYYGSRGSRFWPNFEFLGGLVIYIAYQVQATTKIKPYSDVGISVKTESSAWGKVWSGTWTSRASIMAPGGHDLGSY